jgi:hypothetical protein
MLQVLWAVYGKKIMSYIILLEDLCGGTCQSLHVILENVGFAVAGVHQTA